MAEMAQPAHTAILDTSSPNFMRFGGAVRSGGYGNQFTFSVRQVTAPLVRPVYGDIFLTPQRLDLVPRVNATVGVGETTPEHMCVYTGRSTDKDATYVLKVGEASRDRLDVLLALGLKHGSCTVSIFW